MEGKNIPVVFAVVVTYNGLRWYDRCIGSLLTSDLPVTPIVIDNASSDGSADYIREHFQQVVLIESQENLGFAKANNIGIRYALDHNADYVFLLNQDAWLNEADAISKMLEVFDKEENVGIVNPINMNGSHTALDEQYSTNMPGTMVSDMYIGQMKEYYPTQYINAAAWLMSAACIHKVGGFDTNMFVHYGEDNNYCHRVCYHNYRILIYTGRTVCHDREFRSGHENEYRKQNFRQNDVNDRIMWANINLPIDVDALIVSVQRSIRRSRLTLRYGKISSLKKQLAFYERVKLSREVNAEGGLAWL